MTERNDLDRLYSEADKLSIGNAKKHRMSIAALSVAATLLAIAFLLYDEVYLYGMIVVCGLLVIFMFAINTAADKMGYHKRYIENRLLAEGLRVQKYLCDAGINRNVTELLPWSWQFNVPWVYERLAEICGEIKPADNIQGEDAKSENNLAVVSWIGEQRDYHRTALVKTEHRVKRNNLIVKASLILAVTTYAVTLIFEICWGGLFSGEPTMDNSSLELIRMLLKVGMGGFSAMTLFAGNYYGKLSLEYSAMDHKRMIALLGRVEKDILEKGESEDALINLAREELAENGSWYAYQSKNGPEISI